MSPEESRRGTLYAIAAYSVWGLFPLYFAALKPAGAWEILSHRIVWTLALCAVILLIRRDLAWIRELLGRRRLAWTVVAAALLIAVNWVVYVYAVITGRTSEAALGYFLNPLVTVALGVLVLRERLRPLQWAAVAVGLVAGVYLTVSMGRLPWIALGLATTFATYSLVRKKVGVTLSAMQGLAAETAVLVPIALVMLGVLAAQGQTTFGGHGAVHAGLLLAAGVVTAFPLLLFAAAARRVSLVTIGLIQFMTPVMQLLVAVLALGEQVTHARWVGFAIVWVALILLTCDSIVTSVMARRRAVPAQEPVG